MNKRGLGVAALILIALGVSILLVSSSGIAREWSPFKGFTSSYTVDSIISKCKSECESMNKEAYCLGPKTLKSQTEKLIDITCVYLVEEKLEYNLEKCDKINCNEDYASLDDDPQHQTSPVNNEEIPFTPGEEETSDCKTQIETWINKYTSLDYKPPKYDAREINPVLFKAILLQESSSAFNEGCPYKEIGDDNVSLGLMQIHGNIYCNESEGNIIRTKYGLPLIQDASFEECKDLLKKDKELSIKVASIILREKYITYALAYGSEGKLYSLCNSSQPPKRYYGWQAALRGYNGWTVRYNKEGKCTTNDHYVEDVLTRCKNLNGGKECLNSSGEIVSGVVPLSSSVINNINLDQKIEVDEGYAPGSIGYLNYQFENTFENLEVEVNFKKIDTSKNTYIQFYEADIGDDHFYFGIQNRVEKKDFMLIFSRWNSQSKEDLLVNTALGGEFEIGDYESEFISVRIPNFNLKEGIDYIFSIKKEKDDEVGTWYKYNIRETAKDINSEIWVGSLRFDKGAKIRSNGGTWLEFFGIPWPVQTYRYVPDWNILIKSIKGDGNSPISVVSNYKDQKWGDHIPLKDFSYDSATGIFEIKVGPSISELTPAGSLLA